MVSKKEQWKPRRGEVAQEARWGEEKGFLDSDLLISTFKGGNDMKEMRSSISRGRRETTRL
jgi:hypothetical protein